MASVPQFTILARISVSATVCDLILICQLGYVGVTLQCSVAMTSEQIRAILEPFLEGDPLSDPQVQLISRHLELLLKWNARVNLTSISEAEQIVARHFGESLFAARNLYQVPSGLGSLIDLGSGAGFPGIPIKIWATELHVMLIESRQKKAT